MEQLRDPHTGRAVIREILLRENIYSGPYINQAPEILGLENTGCLFWNWNRTEDKAIFPQKDDPVFSHFFSGFHKMNGLLMMAGANISSRVNNFDAQIADIAPTALYLRNEPIPQEMDGKILDAPISQDYRSTHALDDRWARTSKPREVEALTDSTEAVNKFIEEQLWAIGYIQ